MIMYIENIKEFTKNILHLINKFIKVEENKINIQKSLVLLYTSKNNLKIKFRNNFIQREWEKMAK